MYKNSSWDKPAWPWSVIIWRIARCPFNSRESGWNKCINESCFLFHPHMIQGHITRIVIITYGNYGNRRLFWIGLVRLSVLSVREHNNSKFMNRLWWNFMEGQGWCSEELIKFHTIFPSHDKYPLNRSEVGPRVTGCIGAEFVRRKVNSEEHV